MKNFTLFIFNFLFASRFWAMIASEGSDFQSNQNRYDMEEQVLTLGQQGEIHNSGWGIIYYLSGEYGESMEGGSGPIWRSPYRPYAPPSEYPNFQSAINEMKYAGYDTPENPIDGVTFAMGHVRLASSGCGTGPGESNPPNPHPFIATLPNGKTYSFAHNGIVDKTVLRELITDEWMINNFQPQTFPESGCGGEWATEEGFDHVIDSELYFFWILKNIMAEETGNDLRGIHNALSHLQFSALDRNKNFVLSNGDEIWAYREIASTDNPEYEDFYHSLYWRVVETEFKSYKTVMSQPSNDTNNGNDDVPGWSRLNNNSLVYLPRKGKPFVIENFKNRIDIEQKMLIGGWNWVGFPFLLDHSGTSVQTVLSPITDINDPFSYVDEMNAFGQNWLSRWINQSWQDISNDILGTKGYKLEIIDNDYTRFYTPFSGTKIPPDTPIELTEGENWIHYFLPHSQHPSDAFPQHVLDNMISIQAQHWFMTRRDGQFYVKQDCPPEEQGTENECFQLNYGKMVIVTMREPETFSWIFMDSEDPPLPYDPPSTRHFQYEEQGSYMPVVIENVSTDFIEIGAFNDLDECVGAEVVEGSPVNFKLYNDGLNNIRFETVSGAGRSSESMNHPTDFLPTTPHIENGIHHISLNAFKREPKKQKSIIENSIQIFPNPFNANTDIILSLQKHETVALEIFNIMGQHIIDLHRGPLNEGDHIFHWSGKNKSQLHVPNGVYFYRFSTQSEIKKGKILYLK